MVDMADHINIFGLVVGTVGPRAQMDCRRTLVPLYSNGLRRPRFNPGSKSAGPTCRPISLNTGFAEEPYFSVTRARNGSS